MKLNKLRIASILLPMILLGMSFSGVIFAATSDPVPPVPAVDCRGIVPCCEASGCTFADLILAIKKLVNWGVSITLMLTVVVIAYAGFLYMTSAADPGQRSKANKMFVSVLKGIFYILAAWLIVTLIMSALAKDVPLFLG